MGDVHDKPLVNTKNLVQRSAESFKKPSIGKVKRSTEKISPHSSEETIQKLHERLQSEVEFKSSVNVKRSNSKSTNNQQNVEKTKSENIEVKNVNETVEKKKSEKLEVKQKKSDFKTLEQKKSDNLGRKPSGTRTADSKERVFEKAHLDQYRGASEAIGINRPKTSKIIRNQSDIFSLKKESEIATSIFSVNGSPSRKVYRKTDDLVQRRDEPVSEEKKPQTANPRITRENYNDEKRPSSSYRNPLTGSGLTSNDEYKGKGCKRKDGNPLLGLGYDSEITAYPSSQRIPPGGYSHKLW